jgi:predicted CoA-binding protein
MVWSCAKLAVDRFLGGKDLSGMKHMTREETFMQALLRSSRTIAVIGASPHAERHSRDVVSYLHRSGYDVIPVRPDRASVEGLPTFASLEDFGGSVDLAVIFRRPDAVVSHIREAAGKHAYAVWLPPGAWSREAEREAQQQNLGLVKERCIIEEHQHLAGATGEAGAGHPNNPGVHLGRRAHTAADAPATGYTAGGGGGRSAGGGVRAILDEKITRRRASRKRG